ncbi:class I SAM-dependent methyltransferase [Methylorubrum rhodesianum]|uniref:class I SAM-dependent methyltransferase n=1 Tax=Methylorubrum rhodesianum TaxID=29427 RepID=UPI003D08B2B7
MSEVARGRPWLTDFSGIEGAPSGMLGPREASLLYYLARDRFAGYGEIIDAGAFLGSSAYCLAKGLDENARVQNKSGRLHSYDLFHLWTEPGVSQTDMSEFLKRTYGIDTAGQESTFHIYSRNLGALARHVRIHQGDILQEQWTGRPIEILFIDICKTRPIWQHVIRIFFKSLIPGVSIVVHQDWHHTALPYLHVAQEYMAEYFEILEPKADDSAAFRLIDRIPDNVIEAAAAYRFSNQEQIALVDRAIRRFEGSSRFLKLLKAELLRQQGQAREALAFVEDTYVGHGEAMTEQEQIYFAGCVDGTATAAARDLARAGNTIGFDASKYLARRPEVAADIASSKFDSAFHHYIRFNARDYLAQT